MLTIIECKTRAEVRAFFRAGKFAGYTRDEETYLKRYAIAPLSPLSANGPQALLLAVREGKGVFRALAGVDYGYVRKEGKKTGYFSLFDGEEDEEAAEAVLKAIFDKMRLWGMESVIGPISPDGSGFFMGSGEGDFQGPRGLFTGPDASFACGILRKNGFQRMQTENAYELEIGMENPLSEIARKAEKRFDVTIAPLKPGLFSDQWMKWILSVSKGAPDREMRLLLERIRPFIDKKHSYLTFIKGECTGYLVSIKGRGGILRATTLITDQTRFSAPSVLCLIDAFLKGARKACVRTAEISVINDQNVRSERLVLRFGGRKIRSYTLFTKNVGEN